MIEIIISLVLISVIFHMISVRGKAKKGMVPDELKGYEELYVWIVSFLNPVFSGAIFYYGWKKMLPNKAKRANAISLLAFLIIIILSVIYIILFPEQN